MSAVRWLASPLARRARMCTRSHSGAGGRSGLESGRAGPEGTAFRALDFGNRGISLLLSADNYNQTTNDFTTKARRHKERAKRFETVLLA
ncbi:MAG: hypothetical protein WCP70_12815 [Methanothrix sp.]